MTALEFVEKVFRRFKPKSFLVQQFFKNAGGFQRQSLWSLTAVSETLCLNGAFTRGELTKQPSGLFFKRGRFARKSVPLLCSYLNLSVDLIGTKIQNELFNQIKGWLFKSHPLVLIFKPHFQSFREAVQSECLCQGCWFRRHCWHLRLLLLFHLK